MASTPTSATGATELARRLRPAPGFTLIEILVVVVIFAISAGLVTLRMLPGDGDRARREAEATALLLERAADEAERTGRVLAWHPDGEGSRFEVPDREGGWSVLADDPDFAPRTLQGGLRWGALRFALPQDGPPDGSAAPGSAAAADPAQAGSRVVFLPGQLVADFVVSLGTASAQVLLHGDALGHVRVESVP